MAAPRDNVVFELGMFIGALGHARTFLVQPLDAEVKIPTDLMGFTPQGNDCCVSCPTYHCVKGMVQWKAHRPDGVVVVLGRCNADRGRISPKRRTGS